MNNNEKITNDELEALKSILDDNPHNNIMVSRKCISKMLKEYEMKSKSYEDGLNDMWKFINIVLKMPEKEILETMLDHNASDPLKAVFSLLTPSEAINYLRAFEKEEKIKRESFNIGDVVETKTCRAVITNITGTVVSLLYANGEIGNLSINDITKTDKNVNIAGLLRDVATTTIPKINKKVHVNRSKVRANVFGYVVDVIREQMESRNIPVETIRSQSYLISDLKLDHSDIFDIVMKIEEELEVEIEKGLLSFETVGDFVSEVKRLLN